MSGQAKIELLLELKNRVKTGISKARENINSRVKEMKDDLSGLKNHHAESFKAMREEMPFSSQALNASSEARSRLKTNVDAMKKDVSQLKDHHSKSFSDMRKQMPVSDKSVGFVGRITNKIKGSISKAKDYQTRAFSAMRSNMPMSNKVVSFASRIRDKLSSKFEQMKADSSKLKTHHKKAFSAMREEIPMFDRAMKLLGNPYVLITAGAIALGLAFSGVVGKAADFNSEFVNIQNLNLDKSQESLKTYKTSILDTAMAVGTGAKETAKAFYDVQSATGKYGDDAKQIVSSVGKYSIATGANLENSINSTTKAMKAFKLGVKDIDSYLASNAKTVQTGITTFDELARVQTEFGGAAAGAGQTIDTANKLFAVFTSIAGNAATGATMTKSAFEGLTQKQTLAGIQGMGVKIYKADESMRDLSSILKDVSGQFRSMTPKAIDEIINKIGGPEGLKNMFIKLKTDSKDFFNTIEAFDSSKFNLDKALKNAMGDYNKLKELAANRFETIMIKLGETVLPDVVKAMDKVNNGILWLDDNLDTVKSTIGYLAVGIGTAIIATKGWAAAQWLINAAMWNNPVGAIIGLIALLVTAIVWVSKNTEGWGKSWKATVEMIKVGWKQTVLDFKTSGKIIAAHFTYAIDKMQLGWEKSVASIKYNIELLKLRFKSLGQYIGGIFQNVGKAIKLALKGDFAEAKKALTAPIKTKASVQIEELQKGRAIQKEGFEKRSKDITDTRDIAIQATAQDYLKQSLANTKRLQEAQSQFSITWKKKQEEQEEEAKVDGKKNPLTDDSNTTTDPNGISSAAQAGMSSITGNSQQVRNITVSIDSFIKGGVNLPESEVKGLSMSDIEELLNEMFLRNIRSIETSQ